MQLTGTQIAMIIIVVDFDGTSGINVNYTAKGFAKRRRKSNDTHIFYNLIY